MERTLFENFTNQYSVSRTLRFGLTLKDSAKKNKSHQELNDLVVESEKRIKDKAKATRQYDETELIGDVSKCIEGMKTYLRTWQEIYRRSDQVALTKDFYKRIARKACFDGFWEELNKKEIKWGKAPKSQIIKLASLKN